MSTKDVLAEVGLFNSKSKTYSKATHSMEEIIQANINCSKNFYLNIKEIDKSVPIMYWLPKMHKTPIGARFIVASNNCSAKPPSDTISKIFKMIFNTVESFHNKCFFIQDVKNSGLGKIVTKLNKINDKKKLNLFQLLTLVPYI